jgi:hypothetical protein
MQTEPNRTWEDGVWAAIRSVEAQVRTARAMDGGAIRMHPAVFATLEQTLVSLSALLHRGHGPTSELMSKESP